MTSRVRKSYILLLRYHVVLAQTYENKYAEPHLTRLSRTVVKRENAPGIQKISAGGRKNLHTNSKTENGGRLL